jgi:hypothetical protein
MSMQHRLQRSVQLRQLLADGSGFERRRQATAFPAHQGQVMGTLVYKSEATVQSADDTGSLGGFVSGLLRWLPGHPNGSAGAAFGQRLEKTSGTVHHLFHLRHNLLTVFIAADESYLLLRSRFHRRTNTA